MGFCEHCEGQRFDRARVLRALRELRREMRQKSRAKMDAGIVAAIETIRSLDLPHLETLDDISGEIVH
jgi:hypothetical protein